MYVTPKKFENLITRGRLVISLIGMSNMGKTYWAKKLSALNFMHINCDDLIETKLAPEWNAYGYSGVKAVSRWLGQPYDDQFEANQKTYQKLEKEVMQEIFKSVKHGATKNTIIDTTGSIVHLGKKNCANLKKYSLVVLLDATPDRRAQLLRQYFRESKPVIWENIFQHRRGETRRQALKRCYPKLLALRRKRYRQYADVIIPSNAISKRMTATQFLSLVKKFL